MALAMCPLCSDDEDIELVRGLEGGRRLVRHRCGFEWEHGALAEPRKQPPRSFADLKARFPKAEDVEPGVLERVDRLKARYLATRPDFDPEVAAYWEKYRRIFSREGLYACDPQDHGVGRRVVAVHHHAGDRGPAGAAGLLREGRRGERQDRGREDSRRAARHRILALVVASRKPE